MNEKHDGWIDSNEYNRSTRETVPEAWLLMENSEIEKECRR